MDTILKKNRNNINKDILKSLSENILMEHQIINEDYGFFSEFKQIYYPLKGIKLFSSCENINYSFQEVDYYLLENKKIAKFIMHYSLQNTHRELIEIYSISKYMKKNKERKDFNKFYSLDKLLVQT